MAKKKWIIPVAIVGGVITTPIIILLVFYVVLLFLSSAFPNIFLTECGPYHKPAVIMVTPTTLRNFVESPYHNNEYFYKPVHSDKIYKIADDFIEQVATNRYNRIYEDNGHIYSFNLNDDVIYSLDENGSVAESYKSNKQYSPRAIIGGYGYSLYSFNDKNYNGTSYKVLRFNIVTGIMDQDYELVFRDRSSIITIDDDYYFCDVCNNRFFKVKNLNTFVCLDQANKLFWNDGYYKIESEGNILIQLSDELIDGKFIYASIKSIYTPDCCVYYRTRYFCICSVGQSTIYSFDTTTLEIEEISTLHSGCVPIQAEEGVVRYYYNGYFYENDTKVSQTDTITVGEDYYQYGKNYWNEEDSNGIYTIVYYRTRFYMFKYF